MCMLRREMLAILCHCYVFARECGHRRVPLWPSVHRELEWARSWTPLVMAKCDLPWSEVVTAVDASPYGFGVTEAVDRS